jgi:hypothetical protein
MDGIIVNWDREYEQGELASVTSGVLPAILRIVPVPGTESHPHPIPNERDE